MSRYLKGVEVLSGFWRFGSFLYTDTECSLFNYGQGVAKRIIWRFYWITPNERFYN